MIPPPKKSAHTIAGCEQLLRVGCSAFASHCLGGTKLQIEVLCCDVAIPSSRDRSVGSIQRW